MATFCRSPSLAILAQNCIRNDFKRPEIQKFSGGHAPRPPLWAYIARFLYAAQGHCCCPPSAPIPKHLPTPLSLAFTKMATSCESHRTTAYSNDMHWRMVYLAKALGTSYRDVAALFESTNDIRARDHPPIAGTAKLTKIDKLIILELAIEEPGVYL